MASQLADVCSTAPSGLVLAAARSSLVYLWLAYVLRRFPYTRPWGESLRALLVTQLSAFGATIVDAAPGLFAVALIMVAARWASKAVALLFDAVERGRVSLPGVYPDTAPPTRRLVIAGVWMSALAMAYPYIPGSGTDGVKGMSVFIGVILSFGSAGVIQHLVSGLMLTYARAAHVGDFARIGEVEGTILQIGPIATKMRTPIGEEVTIPNAVVVSQTLTNYSIGSGESAAYLPTSVTIGYDTPWRQVEALLLAAARRTTGLRATPPATVWRVSLDDFYVKYTLLVTPEDPVPPCRGARPAARPYPRRLQRTRRPDHVAALRDRSGQRQGGAPVAVVCAAGGGARARPGAEGGRAPVTASPWVVRWRDPALA